MSKAVNPNSENSSGVPKRLWVLAAVALAGLGLSIQLTKHFYEVRGGGGSFKSFCNIGEAMNCDAVAASRSAEFVFGLPLSGFSAGWYLALLVIALIATNRFWRREALRAAFAMTAFGTFLSVIYFITMASVLKTYCLYCLLVDAVNVVALLIVLSLKPEGFASHKPDPKKWKAFGWVTAAGLALAILSMKLAWQETSVQDSTKKIWVDEVMAAPVVAVSSGSELPSIGPADAAVTIVEFSDFQCPFCRFGALTMNNLVNKFAGKVRVVFRNFPLDPSCNRGVQHSMHQFACEAARVAMCAHRQGRFKPVYEELFENQSEFGTGKMTEIAVRAGADPAKLAECLKSGEVESIVQKDVEDAMGLGVKSTPTFFINGRKVDGALPLPVWAELVTRLAPQ